MKSNVSKWLRIILGLFLIIYALNQFFHFMPTGYGKMPENAMAFIDAVAMFLPLLYVFEIIIGLMLVLNIWSALILLALFPLSFSFVFFMFANGDFPEGWPALFVALMNIVLLVNHRDRYIPALTDKL